MLRPTLEQLAPVARNALEQFGVSARGLQNLRYYNNATYHVATMDGAELVLRVTSNHYSDAELRSEMCWLSAMQGEREVRVPEPVRALNGDWIVHAATEGSTEPRRSVLCRWIPGTHRDEALLGEEELARLGRATALLHRKGSSFVAPPDFTRPRWDASRFLDAADGRSYAGALEYLLDYLAPAAVERVRAMTDELRATMERRHSATGGQGLVHGDFHAGNALFDDGVVGFIDFEDLGWGDPLYDVATALFGLLERPEYPSLRDAFVEAYGGALGLRLDVSGELRHFQLLRALFLTTLAVERGDAAERRWWEGYALGKLQRLLT